MSLRLPPFYSIIFKKSPKTDQYICSVKKRHEELILAIKTQLAPGDELPCFISEDEHLFADIVGNNTETLAAAIEHAIASGLSEGEDFVSLNYVGAKSKVDWLAVKTEGVDKIVTLV